MKIILSIFIAIFISGCTSENILEITLEAVADSEIEHDTLRCNSLRTQCEEQHYSEWVIPSGKFGCACKNLN